MAAEAGAGARIEATTGMGDVTVCDEARSCVSSHVSSLCWSCCFRPVH